MDCLRDDGLREVNHHGKKVAVGGKNDESLFKKNNNGMTDGLSEEEEGCMQGFREKFISDVDYLKLSHFAAKTGIPIVIGIFSALYWSYGLFFYFFPAV